MKQLMILACLCLITLSAAKAQETHTPQYKCVGHGGESFHILIGNSFPQIPDLDYSNEIVIATPQQYLGCDGTQEPAKFELANNFDEKNGVDTGKFVSLDSFRTQAITMKNGTEMSIELMDGEMYVEVFNVPNCEGKECQQVNMYSCQKQLGVDSEAQCNE